MASPDVVSDVVVIGGGVIGLSVAWHLARGGASVTVLERGTVGGGASNASAGMLAPLGEARAPGPFVELGLASLRAYPAFRDALRDEADLDIELIGPGTLRIATTNDAADALCAAFAWQRQSGQPVERLDGDAARCLEPSLSPGVRAAVLSPEEKQVEPRRLVRALALACARRGVTIREHTPVVGLETNQERVTTVRTATDAVPCGALVVAGGAWSAAIGDWLNVALPVFPVGGQILALTSLPPPIRHTIYAHAGYLVPKADGRVVVGATEEPGAGFAVRPTAGGVAGLLAKAVVLIPTLADAVFDSVWTGVRPGSMTGLPILGPLPGWENAHVATGHFRNGILLTPITGEIIAHGILQGAAHPLLGAALTLVSRPHPPAPSPNHPQQRVPGRGGEEPPSRGRAAEVDVAFSPPLPALGEGPGVRAAAP